MGRLEYSLSNNLAYVYKAMLSKEHLRWTIGKETYLSKYTGLHHNLLTLLNEIPEKPERKIYIMTLASEWDGYYWMVERLINAAPKLGLHISGIVNHDDEVKLSADIPFIPRETFDAGIDDNICIIAAIGGWTPQAKKLTEEYNPHIIYPIADTFEHQYFEPDFFIPTEDETFVDVGVFNLDNTIDFINWAEKGFAKVYAFEPDNGMYET
jgi:hypothetical protein